MPGPFCLSYPAIMLETSYRSFCLPKISVPHLYIQRIVSPDFHVCWLVGWSVGWFQHYCSLQRLWASGTGLALPVCNDKTDVFSFARVRQQAAERTEKSWSELLNTTALMRGFF